MSTKPNKDRDGVRRERQLMARRWCAALAPYTVALAHVVAAIINSH